MQRVVLGIGPGRCGMASLAAVLNRQVGFSVTHIAWPLLPWNPPADPAEMISARLQRMGSVRGRATVVGEVAPFLLPYVPAALEQNPELRVVCLQRRREAVVGSFERWLDEVMSVPTDSWTRTPSPGRHHHPWWSQTMPHYDESSRADGIRRYWDDYFSEVERLQKQWPERIHVLPMDGLRDPQKLRELLTFVGVDEWAQVLATDVFEGRTVRAAESLPIDCPVDDPKRCVVLVPFQSHVTRPCEKNLLELERRGFEVRRVSGYANIDLGRSQMATDALRHGFTETMWIDADVEFDPDDVERLRSHQLPITCGIYPKKGLREIACHVLPGTKSLAFGVGGGLHEILYAATGFLHVRREVYETIQCRLPLPLSNMQHGQPIVPFFEPMTRLNGDGHWTMTEDYSFCERARQCGFKVLADTTIRLWHHGSCAYSWEDAGEDRPRYASYLYRFNDSC